MSFLWGVVVLWNCGGLYPSHTTKRNIDPSQAHDEEDGAANHSAVGLLRIKSRRRGNIRGERHDIVHPQRRFLQVILLPVQILQNQRRSKQPSENFEVENLHAIFSLTLGVLPSIAPALCWWNMGKASAGGSRGGVGPSPHSYFDFSRRELGNFPGLLRFEILERRRLEFLQALRVFS